MECDAVTERFAAVAYREKPFQSESRTFLAQLYPAVAPAALAKPLIFDVQGGKAVMQSETN